LIIIQKTEVTFFEGNEYNFDDIDKPMLKKKSWRRVQDMCNHMIFISFFVEINLAQQRSVYIIVQSIDEKPGTNDKIN
jgi:hypothetical protein